jgi:hypothetical protein
MGWIRVGFFQDFKSSDTLLIDGDSDGLRLLSSTFWQLGTTGTTQVAIHELSFVEMHRGLQVYASRSDRDAGAAFEDAGVIAWICSKPGWESASDKVDVLCKEGSGHQYLEDSSDIVVMASIAEYGELWWRKHQ